MRKLIFFILIAIAFATTATAQMSNKQIEDSLQHALVHATTDSVQCVAHLNLCRHYLYFHVNFNKAAYHVAEAEKIAQKIKMPYLLARAGYLHGLLYDLQGNHSKARNLFYRALNYAVQVKRLDVIETVQSCLGISYYYQSKYDSSLLWSFKALQLAVKLNNQKKVADNYNNIGLIYSLSNQRQKAIDYFTNAYTVYSAVNEYYNAVNTLNNIGDTYKEMGMFDSALFHISKALHLAQVYHFPTQERFANTELGKCYNAMQQYSTALIYFKKVEQDPETKFDNYNYANFLAGSSEAYLGLRNYTKAIQLATKATKITSIADNNYYVFYADVYSVLAFAYEGKKDYKNAFFFYKKYKAYSDSLLSEKNINSMNELSAEFEFKQKQSSIDLLENQNKLKNITIADAEKMSIIYVIIVVFLLVLLIALLVFSFKRKKMTEVLIEKNNFIAAALNEREILVQEIHHRVKNNLQVISSLLNLQSKKIKDAAALEAIKDAKSRIKTMALIHQNLYLKENITHVNTKEYVEHLVHHLFLLYQSNENGIALDLEVDNTIAINADSLVSLGLILNELISNSLKHAFSNNKNGRIEVILKKVMENVMLQVKDNGIGLAKNWDKKSTSLGYHIIYSIIRKVNGTIHINNNNGTTVQIIVHQSKLS